jgi:type II secretory pathway pseudopilin PulG
MEAQAATGKGPKYKAAKAKADQATRDLESAQDMLVTVQGMQGKSKDELASEERTGMIRTALQAGGLATGAGLGHFSLKKAAQTKASREAQNARRFENSSRRIGKVLSNARNNKFSVKQAAKVKSLVDEAFDAGGQAAPFKSPGMRRRNAGSGLFRKSMPGKIADALTSPAAIAMGVGGGELMYGRHLMNDPETSDAMKTVGTLGVGMGAGLAATGAKDLYVNPPGADPVQPKPGSVAPVLEGHRRAVAQAAEQQAQKGLIQRMMQSRVGQAAGPVAMGAGIGAMLPEYMNEAQAAVTGQEIAPEVAQQRANMGMQAGAVAGGAAPLAAKLGGPAIRQALAAGARGLPVVGNAMMAADLGQYIYDDLTAPPPTPEEQEAAARQSAMVQRIMEMRRQQMLGNLVAQ